MYAQITEIREALLVHLRRTTGLEHLQATEALQTVARLEREAAEREEFERAVYHWLDKPHREERWQELVALMPDVWHEVQNLGRLLAEAREQEAALQGRLRHLSIVLTNGVTDDETKLRLAREWVGALRV